MSNLSTQVAVYGGSFNPPTMGHYHLIEKAVTIFDLVYIVISENVEKTNKIFSTEEIKAMLEDMAKLIDPSGKKIVVEVLPENIYLVDFANRKNAKFLIRGIRDQLDFGYEQKIYRTNRLIQPNVETIYIMPDDAYNLVSSSWVRGLFGYEGWVNAIKNSVTPYVLMELKKLYLKNIFMKFSEDYISHFSREVVWEHIVQCYSSNKYHGFNHLFELIDLLLKNIDDVDPSMVYSIFMHDIDPSEEKSVDIALSYIGQQAGRQVRKLILATKHTTCDYETLDEQIISSLDLMVLARPPLEYNKYVKEIFEEYLERSGKTQEDFMVDWRKGRSDFLNKMMAHRVIFSWDKMFQYEKEARNNMLDELVSLANDI